MVATLTVEEYLADELQAAERHEYLGGLIFARAGASNDHNVISLNLASVLRNHLRGKPCQVNMADVKLRIEITQPETFYYPDVMVSCDRRDIDPYFKRFPQVLIEVLSPQTEQIDRREKFVRYIQIETLKDYVLVAQDRPEVTIFRRANQWQPEVICSLDGYLQLTSLSLTIPLSQIYEGVKL